MISSETTQTPEAQLHPALRTLRAIPTHRWLIWLGVGAWLTVGAIYVLHAFSVMPRPPLGFLTWSATGSAIAAFAGFTGRSEARIKKMQEEVITPVRELFVAGTKYGYKLRADQCSDDCQQNGEGNTVVNVPPEVWTVGGVADYNERFVGTTRNNAVRMPRHRNPSEPSDARPR